MVCPFLSRIFFQIKKPILKTIKVMLSIRNHNVNTTNAGWNMLRRMFAPSSIRMVGDPAPRGVFDIMLTMLSGVSILINWNGMKNDRKLRPIFSDALAAVRRTENWTPMYMQRSPMRNNRKPEIIISGILRRVFGMNKKFCIKKSFTPVFA